MCLHVIKTRLTYKNISINRITSEKHFLIRFQERGTQYAEFVRWDLGHTGFVLTSAER